MTIILCGGGRPILEIVKRCPMPIVMVYTHEGNGQLTGSLSFMLSVVQIIFLLAHKPINCPFPSWV